MSYELKWNGEGLINFFREVNEGEFFLVRNQPLVEGTLNITSNKKNKDLYFDTLIEFPSCFRGDYVRGPYTPEELYNRLRNRFYTNLQDDEIYILNREKEEKILIKDRIVKKTIEITNFKEGRISPFNLESQSLMEEMILYFNVVESILRMDGNFFGTLSIPIYPKKIIKINKNLQVILEISPKSSGDLDKEEKTQLVKKLLQGIY